ncbi:MAG: hypothetical protein KF774_17210 [Planctomyces sp.]|nr:hypothetical protein [Planctomyces sp.]
MSELSAAPPPPPATSRLRSPTRLGLAALLALTTLAHSRLPAADPAEAPNPLDACEVYPLGVGREWTFQSGPAELHERVTKHELIGEELCARVETTLNNRIVSYEHIAVRDDGVYRVAIAGKPIEPPLRFIMLPARAGDTWKVDSQIVGQSVRGEFKTDVQTVKIGGEEVSALVVDGRNFRAGDNEIAFKYFFVPQVGKAKQIVETNGQTVTLELRALPNPAAAKRRTARSE